MRVLSMRFAWLVPSIISSLALAAPAFADEPAPSAPPEVASAAAPTTTAAAPTTVAAEPETSDVYRESGAAYGETLAYIEPRSYAKNWLVAPPGWTFGGQMKFITANTSLFGTNQRLRFADMAILSLETRITAGRRLELSGSVDLLAKQPDGSTESIAQGGTLGAKIATSRTLALTAAVSGGPTLGVDGLWGSAGGGVLHRSHIEEFIAFQVGAGAQATVVRPQELGSEWQADLVGSSELVFHTPRGEWAMWGGLGLALPVVHSEGIAPSTRLDVTIGTVFSAVKDWDLYTEFTLRDRGTTDMPGTVLPIADGGFDQKQIVFGITRRFTERGTSRWALSQ